MISIGVPSYYRPSNQSSDSNHPQRINFRSAYQWRRVGTQFLHKIFNRLNKVDIGHWYLILVNLRCRKNDLVSFIYFSIQWGGGGLFTRSNSPNCQYRSSFFKQRLILVSLE